MLSIWVIIIIGLPLWWKTTEIYRAQLPFAEIEEWSKKRERLDIKFSTHFTLFIATNVLEENNNFNLKNLDIRLKESIASKYNLINNSKSVQFPVKFKIKEWNEWKDVLKEDFNLGQLNFTSKNGKYAFYILPGNNENKKTKVLVGNQRQAIVQIEQIEHWNLEPSTEANVELDSMRTMKYSPMYQVTFSLMNGDPSSLLVNWDIDQTVNKYLKPFVDKISVISNLIVESQIQHYARLTFEPQQKKIIENINYNNDNDKYFYLTPDLLPHFINAAEWKLASAVSSYPTLNFILYVPSLEQSPLYIQDSKENIIKNNAFLIPRWGGVVINNPDRSTGIHNFTSEELKSVMSIFIMQLRGLLGVQDFWVKAGSGLDSSVTIEFTSPQNTAITMWELDSLVRRRIAENIVATILTLKSLSQLVAEIPNMVVLDHIQTEVLLALDSLKKSCTSLQEEQYEIALQHAKKAIERAESAFFDPTMRN
ncbi:7769_t:CDS:10 [Diversispora eburnea]|uniref:7769_t:CDS:1 n=1 Tax=Diversispora eburnea TaxID=1213867 RepID=A0A9N8V4F9_9GLOM|nr:7769_t:CDS:10 [Diversispora eburnea]